MAQTTQNYLINFGSKHGGACEWFVVLDGVMGGLSEGTLSQSENSITLKGKISLENNGGFASIRPPYGEYDLSKYTHLEIRYRAVGQSFAFTLNQHRRFFMPRYKHVLAETEGRWRVEKVELATFKRFRLSEELKGNPSVKDLANIIRLGLISNDKAATEYQLEVDYITFY